MLVSFYGKHSKDRFLSIYLNKRVFVDDGEPESVTGVLRVNPDKVINLPTELAIFCQLSCSFIFESSNPNTDIVDATLFERTVQVYPKNESLTELSSRMELPDKFYFPFEFLLPYDLPPSISFNPGYAYYGKPLGISYEVTGFLGNWKTRSLMPSLATSSASVRFRRATYFPLLEEIRPSKTEERNFLVGNPLILTASLDKEVYYPGQPILVTVNIHNDSNHDVHAVKISAKQSVSNRIGESKLEDYKCQVALLESTKDCPIKKHARFSHTFSITPQIYPSESQYLAYRGLLHMTESLELAPSTRFGQFPHTRKGVHISYYLNVHAQISLAKDVIVKLPFILSGSEKRGGDNVLLEPIAKETGVEEHVTTQIFTNPRGSMAQPGLPAPVPQAAIQFREEYPVEPTPETEEPITFLQDITEGRHILKMTRRDLVDVQAAAAQKNFQPMAPNEEEIPLLVNCITTVGLKLNDFLSDAWNPPDGSISSTTATLSALEIEKLESLVKSLASHSNNLTQQYTLHIMRDLLDRVFLLFDAAAERVRNTSDATILRKLADLADLVSQTLNSLKKTIPGTSEVEATIDTINVALYELTPESTINTDAETLQLALDDLNSFAFQLAKIIERVTKAPVGQRQDLTNIAREFQIIIPGILAKGKIILGGLESDQRKQEFITLFQNAALANSQLLISIRECFLTPKDPNMQAQVQTSSNEVITTMRKLLSVANSLQAVPIQKTEAGRGAGVGVGVGAAALQQEQRRASSSQQQPLPQTQAQQFNQQTGQLGPQGQETLMGGVASAAAAAAAAAVPLAAIPLERRPSGFEDEIVQREGFVPSTIQGDYQQDEGLQQLGEVSNMIDQAHRMVFLYRTKVISQERESAGFVSNLDLGVSSGYGNEREREREREKVAELGTEAPASELQQGGQWKGKEKEGTTTTTRPRSDSDFEERDNTVSGLLDAALSIIQTAVQLGMAIQDKYKEFSIIGSNFPSTSIPLSQKEILVSSAKLFAAEIVNFADACIGVVSGINSFQQLVEACNATSNAANSLASVANSLTLLNSTSRQRVTSLTKEITTEFANLISVVMLYGTSNPAAGTPTTTTMATPSVPPAPPNIASTTTPIGFSPSGAKPFNYPSESAFNSGYYPQMSAGTPTTTPTAAPTTSPFFPSSAPITSPPPANLPSAPPPTPTPLSTSTAPPSLPTAAAPLVTPTPSASVGGGNLPTTTPPAGGAPFVSSGTNVPPAPPMPPPAPPVPTISTSGRPAPPLPPQTPSGSLPPSSPTSSFASKGASSTASTKSMYSPSIKSTSSEISPLTTKQGYEIPPAPPLPPTEFDANSGVPGINQNNPPTATSFTDVNDLSNKVRLMKMSEELKANRAKVMKEKPGYVTSRRDTDFE